MTSFSSSASVQLDNLPNYIDRITDRLLSFQSQMAAAEDGQFYQFPWGTARLHMPAGQLRLEAEAPTADGLARLKDILAMAVELYAKEDKPNIIWQGDLSDTKLSQFRLATVREAFSVTPHMRRVRLAADDLERFESFGGMHIRMLLPTPEVPNPVWPEQGPNGLPLWPDEARKPVSRVYTIREIDRASGTFDVDMVVHADGGPGSTWAETATPGMQIGIMGPLGRPIPEANWYVMGADETGIPAVSRLLSRLSPEARGVIHVEVANRDEQQELPGHPGFEINWIHRDGIAPGNDHRLSDAVCQAEWPSDQSGFGWFAGEATMAKIVREYWRGERGLDRKQTLVAGYWRIGAAGVMAG